MLAELASVECDNKLWDGGGSSTSPSSLAVVGTCQVCLMGTKIQLKEEPFMSVDMRVDDICPNNWVQ